MDNDASNLHCSGKLRISPYQAGEAGQLYALFKRAVRQTAAADYTPEQVEAWIGCVDLRRWEATLRDHATFVARCVDESCPGELSCPVGFCDIDASGYLDRLYVDPAFRRRGVARTLFEAAEAYVRSLEPLPHELVVHASITARGFFEHMGFAVVCEQQVRRGGVVLSNYVMKKPLARRV